VSTINVTDDMAEVSASVGDTIVVRLVEPGATGYQWSILIDGDSAVEGYSTLQVSEDGPVAPGAGAVRVVGLRAEHPGPCEVLFALSRPWEKAVAPAQTRELHVDVVR
jgi:predicted secreted protein